MRNVTGPERATAALARLEHHSKIEVRDAAGTWQNMGTLSGIDWTNGWEIAEDIDQQVMTATVRFRRGSQGVALAPLITTAPPNTTTGSFAPLLYPGRRLRISAATVAPGADPTAAFKMMGEFKIDRVDWHSNESIISVECRDVGAWIIDAFIENETVYGSTPGGTPIQTVVQDLIDDYPPPGGATLVVIDDPLFNILAYTQDKTLLGDAIGALALQAASDIRYRFRNSDDAFVLALWKPDRAKTTEDWTLGPDEYEDVSQLNTSDADIRNAVKVNFIRASDGTHQSFTATDATSITQFGRRYMEITEDAASQIDTDAEAITMATAARDDLSLPKEDQEVKTKFLWFVQLSDLGKFLANGVHYNTDEKLGVVGIRHVADGGEINTFVRVRGKPAGAFRKWLNQPTSSPREMLMIRVLLNDVSGSEVEAHVYVADSGPGGPILITATGEGVGTITPTDDLLIPGVDAITADVLTTAFKSFIIDRPPTGDPQGRVTFTAERVNDPKGTVTASIDISPSEIGIGLALRLILQKAGDTSLILLAYLADSNPGPQAARMIRASGHGIDGVAHEDGQTSAILGSRGTMVLQPRNLTLAPWVMGTGTETYEPAEIAPDASLGVFKLVDAGAGDSYIHQQIGAGDFNGFAFTVRIWARVAVAGVSFNFGLLQEGLVPIAPVAGTFTPTDTDWHEYELTGMVAAATSLLYVFAQIATASAVGFFWYPHVVRGTIADVTDDLDTTDFVRFVVTRPPRTLTATNLILQSDKIATAPWALGGGGVTVTDNAATFGGVSFSRIIDADTGVWVQPMNIEEDGEHVVSFQLHAFPGDVGTISIPFFDNTIPGTVAQVVLTALGDGSIEFSSQPSGTFLSIEKLSDNRFEVAFKTPALDAAHDFFAYATGGGTTPSYYISRFKITKGAALFPADIPTTIQRATITIDSPDGVVELTATRDGLSPVSQSLTISPTKQVIEPTPLLEIEAEGTSRDGNGQGQVRLIVNFDEHTNQVDVYTTEGPTANQSPESEEHRSPLSIRRAEGVIASDVKFRAEFDIGTTTGFYRAIRAFVYGGYNDNPRSRPPQVQELEAQAVDTGTAPTGAPTGLAVSFTEPGGVPRATVSFTVVDSAAHHRVFRNGVPLIRLDPGDAAFVDDGLTPGKIYSYRVQAIRDGQTSEFSDGIAGGGSGGSSGGGTLTTPSWLTGYPTGGSGILGEPAFVNLGINNPNVGAGSEVYMSPGAPDTGPYILVASLGPGNSYYTVNASDVGAFTGDSRYFYIVAKRAGYTDSAESTHVAAIFAPSA